ncbi:hypothetical protein [Rhodococcus sp. SJ-2]
MDDEPLTVDGIAYVEEPADAASVESVPEVVSVPTPESAITVAIPVVKVPAVEPAESADSPVAISEPRLENVIIEALGSEPAPDDEDSPEEESERSRRRLYEP